MNDAELLKFVLKVLETTGGVDGCDQLRWRCDEQHAPVKFFLNVSDVFWWACADSEEVTPANLEDLERAVKDVQEATGKDGWVTPPFWAELFAARRRKLRPQGCFYENMPGELWPPFDACGPERIVDVGNTPKPKEPKS